MQSLSRGQQDEGLRRSFGATMTTKHEKNNNMILYVIETVLGLNLDSSLC